MIDCKLWNGRRMNSGYGILTVGGQNILAHRFVWEKQFGKIPNGMEVMHLCDVKACVNPNHLAIGTHADNLRMAGEHGLMNPYDRRGDKNPRTKLTWHMVRQLRKDAKHLTTKELVKKYRIQKSEVRYIVLGETWRE